MSERPRSGSTGTGSVQPTGHRQLETSAAATADQRTEVTEPVRIDDPEFGQVLECVLGISSHERRTYFALLEAPGSTTTELAVDLDRDRSSVNRSLSALSETGLIQRDRKILDGGGYVYHTFRLRFRRPRHYCTRPSISGRHRPTIELSLISGATRTRRDRSYRDPLCSSA
nr:helix-turn-helix domain-containing protein [Natrinema sp. 1APR25-10V2]